MRQTFRTATIAIALLATAATSCQKENYTDPTASTIQAEAIRTVCYVVDGNTRTTIVRGDDNWHAFLEYLTTLAEEGHDVVFWNSERPDTAYAAKETVTYTTKDRKDAINWMDKMYAQNYQVSYTYDPDTGIYTCTATK